MKRKMVWLAVGIMCSYSFFAGCSRAPKVTRTAVDTTVDLSGQWNDTDSRLVAEEMIRDCTTRPWLARFEGQNNRKPVVIVGPIINRSHEHIDSEVFVKDLEKSLLNSDRVTFVASSQERIDVRAEREDQQDGYTDPETIKAMGKETGADFMLQGSVHSIKDEIRGKYVILYQVNLELINLTNNQKTWIGQKEIKKVVARPQYSM